MGCGVQQHLYENKSQLHSDATPHQIHCYSTFSKPVVHVREGGTTSAVKNRNTLCYNINCSCCNTNRTGSKSWQIGLLAVPIPDCICVTQFMMSYTLVCILKCEARQMIFRMETPSTLEVTLEECKHFLGMWAQAGDAEMEDKKYMPTCREVAAIKEAMCTATQIVIASMSHSRIWSILWTHSKHGLPFTANVMSIFWLVEYSCVLCKGGVRNWK